VKNQISQPNEKRKKTKTKRQLVDELVCRRRKYHCRMAAGEAVIWYAGGTLPVGSVTLCILLSCPGCDIVYTSVGSVDVLPSTHNVEW